MTQIAELPLATLAVSASQDGDLLIPIGFKDANGNPIPLVGIGFEAIFFPATFPLKRKTALDTAGTAFILNGGLTGIVSIAVPQSRWSVVEIGAYIGDLIATGDGQTIVVATLSVTQTAVGGCQITAFSSVARNAASAQSVGYIPGPPGPPGPYGTLSIGTVTQSPTAAATITGVSPNQLLNLVLPPGPANTLAIGSVTTLPPGSPATAAIGGVAPNQTLSLGIPAGTIASPQGPWNATTNTPALASGVGTQGYTYRVSVAGTTNLDGIAVWEAGDTAYFDGTRWDKFGGPSQDFSQITVAPVGRTSAGPLTGTLAQIGNSDGSMTRVEVDSYAAASHFSAVRANGTLAAPSALVAANSIGSFNGFGHNGTGFVGPAAALGCYAAETWSSGHQGTYWRVSVTAIGATTLVDSVSFENDGSVLIPPTVPGGSQGAGSVNAAGLYVAGVAVATLSGQQTLTNKTLTSPTIGGGTLDNAAIGSKVPASAAFTTVSVSGSISGAGFSAYLASPPPIGSVAPAAGSFTILATSGQIISTLATGIAPLVVASTTIVANLNASLLLGGTWASPGAIGSTAASSGAFTTLAASGTVSGAGFATYLTTPPPIGGTTPAAAAFTNLSASGAVTFTGASVTVPTAAANDSSLAAANTQWVQQLVSALLQNLQLKPDATVATAAALPSYSYANNVITASANGALIVDGFAVVAGSTPSLVLVKNEVGANAPYNGLYVVTATGSASSPFVLTRHVDMQTAAEFAGAFVVVTNASLPGGTQANSFWLCNPSGTVTVGTTPIPFTQINGATDLIPGLGIVISGNTISASATNIAGSFLAPNVTGSSLTGVGTLTSGATGAGFTVALGTSTITGTLGLANGGLGATTAFGARANIGAAASGANGDIVSLSGLTTPLSILQGGTGANSGPGAAAALGITGRTPVADAAVTATATSRTIAYTALTAPRVVTLPTAASFPTGTSLTIVDEPGACSATNTITIQTVGSDKINGAASAVLTVPYGYIAIESNGSNAWTIIDQSVSSLILDGLFGSTRGTVIVRGVAGYQGVNATASGQTLQFNGSDTVFAASSPGTGSVRYDTPQTLTTAQQQQVLTNIGGKVPLATLTANNTSTVLQDTTHLTSSYSEYEIIIEGLIPASSGQYAYLQVYSGGAYQTAANTYNFGIVYSHDQGVDNLNSSGVAAAIIPLSFPAAGQTGILNSGASPNLSDGLNLTLKVSNPAGTMGVKHFNLVGGYNTSSYGLCTWQGCGFWNSAAAVTGFQISTSSGNWLQGTVKIYGIAN